ncbi:cytochrome P450 [Cunninghamella echinulata]|nr:cytochrome P450 [Cunninghamella echinulata]
MILIKIILFPISIFILNFVFKKYTSRLRNAPTPKKGNFWITQLGLVPPPSDGKDTLSEFLIHVGQDVNQSPISVCYSLMGTPLVLVNTLKGIKDVLINGQAKNKKTSPCVQRGDLIRRIQNLVFGGPSINNTIGEDWKWRRHILLPPFQPRQLVPKLLPYVSSQANNLLKIFEQYELKKAPLEMDNVFTDLTMNVINFYLYGRSDLNYDIVGGRSNLKKEHLKLGLGFQSIQTWLPFGINKTDWAQQSFKPSRELLKSFIRDSLNRVQGEYEQLQQNNKKTDDYHCVAAAALASGKYNHDREELVNDLLSLTFAGYDTTAHTLSFCFSELARDPQLQERVFQQVRQVLGPPSTFKDNDDFSSYITPEKLARLTLVTAVYKETLRKYPAVVFIPVHVNRDILVDGVVVPGGAEIWCNIRGIQMNPSIFPHPEEFNIDRWLVSSKENDSIDVDQGFDTMNQNNNNNNKEENKPITPETQYLFPDITFTLGQHACLGKNLAILELRTVIATVINQFTFSLQPGNKIETKIVLTTKPKNGVWINFVKRKD